MSSVLCNYQLDHLESFFNSLHLTENVRSNYTQRRRVLRLTPLPNLVILSCGSVSCLSPHPPISLTHTHIFSLSLPLSLSLVSLVSVNQYSFSYLDYYPSPFLFFSFQQEHPSLFSSSPPVVFVRLLPLHSAGLCPQCAMTFPECFVPPPSARTERDKRERDRQKQFC